MEENEAHSNAPRPRPDSKPLPTDSMVTVSLSEASSTRETLDDPPPIILSVPGSPDTITSPPPDSPASRPSSLDLMNNLQQELDSKEEGGEEAHPSPVDTLDGSVESIEVSIRSRSSTNSSKSSNPVDWDALDKSEEKEAQDEGSDDHVAMLLARLEQENNSLANDPKATVRTKDRLRKNSRPASVQQLKKLVLNNRPASIRLSQLPTPQMTELEFWAALVQDYPNTAQRLPTLTANKVRSGIPAPLRGVVWVSMAGAADKVLEDAFDRLCGESSPYENMIGKDIGRSFPGVEMFREANGEGQRMLGRVLKCFSLYDEKIGYCQGLGFLVGPLLMQMGERDAFCVLVRLMEDYDLRACFLPDLSGLHLRIYQFQCLLEQHLPKLAAHLHKLQVEGSYLSQWFLSFFAVTCPLPLLFRIYDVIFAEGASETIMRVALAIMQRNEAKILGSSEFEDVMHLLLSRQLWDSYGLNAQSADELVADFVGFSSAVTRESLTALESSFTEAQKRSTSAGYVPEAQASATRFLGRLWSSNKSSSLSPGLTAPSRPSSYLQRTPSKQSLASTLNSFEATSSNSDSVTSLASTAITEQSERLSDIESSGETLKQTKSKESAGKMAATEKDKAYHTQIEDLLKALGEMQVSHSSLALELQREREEREEDRRVMKDIVDGFNDIAPPTSAAPSHARSKSSSAISSLLSIPSLQSLTTAPSPPKRLAPPPTQLASPLTPHLLSLIEAAAARIAATESSHRVSMHETKEELTTSLSRTRDALSNEMVRSQDLTVQLATATERIEAVEHEFRGAMAELSTRTTEASSLKDDLNRCRDLYKNSSAQNEKLQATVRELKADRERLISDARRASNSSIKETAAMKRQTTTGPKSGLRPFQLGRSSTASLATPSSPTDPVPVPSSPTSTTPNDARPPRTSSLLNPEALLTELNRLKTELENTRAAESYAVSELANRKASEAAAQAEVDEMRQKFNALRKAMTADVGSVGVGRDGHVRGAVSVGTFTPPEERKEGSAGSGSGSGTGYASGSWGWGWGKR
ncbi:hypothetical protein P152DRAFT_474019 [Eremomyces bilateralis CBS 781.70]|uniref:Rab-GAP TBC domain-containing protein n=1 Tax=Eremomyces bilateralis CBS 781.70 TaxID=1392243 RepID=A0A6G1G323_9PEZI|nr:uncharacterized protein P152DRAFT_474019 [Eremomyces bilateralis CBS 781.70]KAF1812316.1 hypothetical protein P152DRAFT_474019 [Eremomyces bilateralis CBS 781.70]